MYKRFFGVSAMIFCAAVSPAAADTGGTVRGTVVSGGKPVAAAKVTISGEDTVRSMTTDAQGRFTFSGVTFGSFTVDADAPGLSANRRITLQSGGIVALTLPLQPLKEIGNVSTTIEKGPASQPIAVTTLDRRDIAASPDNQSLDRLIETVPGIVRFSYDEPVAHGFHGLSYEIDGVPVPQGTAANFSETIDPRSIDSLEVITGAFPAEYGGQRMGALVNVVSDRLIPLDRPQSGALTVGLGTYGDAQTSLSDAIAVGGKTEVFFNGNIERTNRGLDTPTINPINDASNQTNAFLRSITDLGRHQTLAFDYLENDAKYQIPINTDPDDPNDPVSSPPGTGDTQHEDDQLISAVYRKSSADGNAYTTIAPWYRDDRVRYDGDIQNDLASVLNNGDGTTSPLNGLTQDRESKFTGLRVAHFHLVGTHALKAGVDLSRENFRGTESIAYLSPGLTTFSDNSTQQGSNIGAYIQDKWTPTRYTTVSGGLRYDRSTGYVSDGQLSPRLEFDAQIDPKDVFHAYYGRSYAAPFLEDTRRAAVVLAGSSSASLPVYDLKPEHDAYVELGLAHTLSPVTRWYLNLWKRDVNDVLDTTSLAQTPIQAVFNNTVGVAKGIEARIESRRPDGDDLAISATVSQSQAGGVNGGTFLFCPPGSDPTCDASNNDITLQPEDHDQTVAVNATYTKHFGAKHEYFASLEPEYGTGYPVEFQDGEGRLPPHLTFDLSAGRAAGTGPSGHLGFTATVSNVFNRQYLIKVNNGFNTTQYAAGIRADIRITKPF